ncbi:MAG TPA: aminodeoxychorismate synthase component I, partial [Gammaproteobacteria bacterium]|nr:aminodeoxychorismate synthase component I [Gammaproteobacteria bacterium]
MTRVVRLSYPHDTAMVFERVRDMPWPVLLESGTEYLPGARFDVVTADPTLQVSAHGARTMVTSRHETRVTSRDPLEILREAIGAPIAGVDDLPFTGGALGYIGYDYGRRHESIGSTACADIEVPDVAMGLYDWAVVIDHREHACWLVGHGRDERTLDGWPELIERFNSASPATREPEPFSVTGPIVSNLSRREYANAFERVKCHIAAGDCYQINLTQRFSASASGDAWDAYRRLRSISPAPYAAYLEYPFARIASSSPEQFLKVRDGMAQTKPIKGTRARAQDPREDAERARELAMSAKDRAENVMIVDLLRNDFGRCCAAGSVTAARLFDIESFANVHHLVSTVEGTLAGGCDAVDLLIACFPGGSITGAPKIRAMQIIDDLEPHRRSIYCGSIGYIGYDGAVEMNIAIRTLLMSFGRV